MSHRPSLTRTASSFLAQLAQALGWRLALSAAVAVALALAEGIGLLLLVPLLSSIGLAVDDGPAGRIAGLATRALAGAGMAPSLAVVLLVFLTVSAVHAVLYRVHLLLNPSLEQRFSTRLRTRLYAAIVAARWSLIVRRRASDLVHAVTVHVDRSSTAAYQLLTLLTGLAVTAVYVLLAFRLSATLTALVMVVGALMLWMFRGRTTHSANSGEAYSEADRRLFAMTSESIAGLKVAKSLAAEPRDVAIFTGLADRRAAAYLGLLRSFADGKMRLDLTSALTISALLYVAVSWLHLSGASLLLLIFVFARLMPRAMALQESAQLVVAGLPSFAAVMKLIDDCTADAEPADPGGERVGLLRAVQFDDVSYRYADGPDVVRGVTLAIDAGRVTAIVGPSGAGKSTLADLLLGLLTPLSGSIIVDGQPLDQAQVRRWRRSIGYVSQDVFLLHDTIRANLAWARPDASDEEMWIALERASAAAFVRARHEGLDTIVGDRGVQLSGGERQRLALARALLTGPDLLVLDEATSALDAVNERRILDAVAALATRVTTVIITHRLTAVRDAHVIHVIENGERVETGSWQDLVSRQGAFARLLAGQGLDAAGLDQSPDRSPAAISGRAAANHGQ